jgi:hypothetical protein
MTDPKNQPPPNKSMSKPQKSADTFPQAAVLLGTTAEVLKAARNAGCPGFTHSRFRLPEISAWLDKHPDCGRDKLSPQDLLRVKIQRQWRAREAAGRTRPLNATQNPNTEPQNG